MKTGRSRGQNLSHCLLYQSTPPHLLRTSRPLQWLGFLGPAGVVAIRAGVSQVRKDREDTRRDRAAEPTGDAAVAFRDAARDHLSSGAVSALQLQSLLVVVRIRQLLRFWLRDRSCTIGGQIAHSDFGR